MPGEAPNSGAYMWCSDCREALRQTYFALNERPICARCKPAYAEKIRRTDGPGAMVRVGLQGGIVAVVGVIVLIALISMFPPFRILPLIPIGYLVGTRMMKALDGYSARRYQYLAVGMTYLCFLIGFAVPAGFEEAKARERREAVRAKMQNTVATQTDALRDEMAQVGALPGSAEAAASSDGDGEEREQPATAQPAGMENLGPGPGLALVLFLLLPFIAVVQLGMSFSIVGMMSLGYALYQAWNQTDGQGMHLQLRGPFRVGQGPIAAR